MSEQPIQILRDEQGNSYLQLDGHRIDLGPSEYSVTGADARVGFLEFVNILIKESPSLKRLNQTLFDISGSFRIFSSETTRMSSFSSFLEGIKAGETWPLVIALSSIMLGIVGFSYILSESYSSASDKENDQQRREGKEKEEKVDIKEEENLRDFTLDQLRQFNGEDKDKPIYISLKHDVFDVSSARDFYGEGSSYNCFAGREASRAMALFSFDEADLSNLALDDLGIFQKNELDNWYDKFKYYKQYPIVGKLSIPPKDLKLTRDQLSNFKGLQQVPEGRIDAPIYVGVNGMIFDVSYGGKAMYGEGTTYFIFAGIDASRALAKMSFNKEDLVCHETSDLTAEELKILADWEKRLSSKYPIVGKIV